MPGFRYIAIDASGQEVHGELSAQDADEALARVRGLGHMPVEVTAARHVGAAAQGDSGAAPSRRRITGTDITTFTRQLSDLTAAGLPIDRALTVLVEQSDNPALANVLLQVQAEIRGGKSLSEALAANRRLFSPMYTNMLHAGEASGQLPEVTTRLAEFMEKELTRRSQLISAMVYPTMLLGVAVLAVVFLLIFVVPRLGSVFTDLGAELPLPTVLLLAVTGIVSKYWWMMLASLAGAWIALKGYAATAAGRHRIDTWMLRLPIIGRITSRVVMSRFARALGTLLGGGVPILDSLAIAGQAADNRATIAAAETVANLVRQGEPLATAMSETGHFPPVLRHMAAVGEETGELPRMLLRVADSLDFEVDNAMRRLTTALEPAIVLITGGLVGFIVLSILLPIFQANTAVK